jgi:hypothetical protein
VSRLDEIKARYGWCERCANHDPRDRRDHGHLRSQTESDALWLVDQVESLERWKVEAIEVMILTAERDDMAWQRTQALNERNALAAQVARVEKLAEEWRYKGEFGWGAWQLGEGPDPEGYVMDHCASALRAALADSEADTTDPQSTEQEDQS